MTSRQAFLHGLLATAAVALAPFAQAQTFPIPAKPIRIVVPFPAGGQTDIQARLLASKLQPLLGTTVLVDNKPGASSILGTMEVVRAPADGHTLLYTISVTAAQNPHLFSKLPYDPFKDLTPVMFAARSTTVLTVPANSPFNSVADLIKFANANPGKLNYASYSAGSTSHLVCELMQQATGTQMTHIPFKGSADAGLALMAGQVDFLFDGPTTAMNNARAGKVKLLAYTDPKPYVALGKLPNMAEAGVPGVDVSGGLQFFGPAKLPADVLAKLNGALATALKEPDVVKAFIDGGSEVLASSPADHAAAIREQHERWGGVIRKLGLKLD